MLGRVFYFVFLQNLVLSAQGDDLLTISSDVKLTETPADFKSTLPEFKYTNCGGPAKVVDWRCEGCDASGTCTVPDGKNLLCQFTFVPSESIPGGISLQFVLTPADASSRTYDVEVPNGSVKGGTTYTLETTGGPSKDLKGKGLKFQCIVKRKENKATEACAQADVKVA